MPRLWTEKKTFRRIETEADLREAVFYPERFLPYERRYGKLEEQELSGLLKAASQNHWEVLDLRLCGLRTLPEELGTLYHLRVLALGNDGEIPAGEENTFTALPESAGGLENLQILDCYKTQLAALPEDAVKWKALTEADFGGTCVGGLPEEIWRLENLHRLNLGGTLLRKIPDRLPPALETLLLNGTGIRTLPPALGELDRLRTLDLHDTFLHDVPEGVWRMKNLCTLNLNGTRIADAPADISGLRNLRELDLGGTLLEQVPGGLEQMTHLRFLNLSGTRIREIPDGVDRLENLQTLDLHECRLREIPGGVVRLGLPFETNNRYRCACVNLTGVTLSNGDFSLFEQDRALIEAAYRNRKPPTQECKVIVLGDGAAGKSSLIERMVHDKFKEGSLPTDGVKITKWSEYPDGTPLTLDGKPLTIRFLDFGGQEIMHSMHRCFLTSHTVYVVVCPGREDSDIDRTASRWLETVKTFAPGCPVILTLSKADQNPNASVNERDLRERYPDLQKILKTSAKAQPDEWYGVRYLMEAITDAASGILNTFSLNADMLAVKEELENIGEDGCIYAQRYREICANHHITDRKMQRSLLNTFRDMGVVYYYESEELDPGLTDMRVLDPEWLTNGIYRLILRTENGGFLSHTDIKETLHASHPGDVHPEIVYQPEETSYILHIMRLFEISHYMGNGEEMIPLKMPKSPPERYERFDKTKALHLRWTGRYLPLNLIHRLMVREYGDLDRSCVWRFGGRFLSPGGRCEALAEMNDDYLDLYVNGKTAPARGYLSMLRGVILDLIHQMNLNVREDVFYRDGSQEGSVPCEDLIWHYQNHKSEIYIPGIRKYVDPAELLRNLYII